MLLKTPIALSLALIFTTASLTITTVPALAATTEVAQTTNPFYQVSALPLQYPPFDKIKDSDFAPAFDRGMLDNIKEIDAIANNPAAETFDNTILEMERSGQLLRRATVVFGNLTGANTNDTLDKLDANYSPKFAAHNDRVYLNAKLFSRIKALYEKRSTLGLDAQGVRLVERYYIDFVRAGANLTEAQKNRVKAINAKLATLSTKFNQNVLAEVNDSAVIVDNRADLVGLSDDEIDKLAASAKEKGKPGKYRIALLNTTIQPLLPQLDNRALRERLHKASIVRGSRGNQGG